MATHSGRWLVVLACLGLMVGRVYAADSADSNTGEAVSSDAAADDTPDASDSSADSTDSSGDAADSEGGAVVAGSPSAPGASTVAADDSAAALSARPDAQDLITMNFQNVDIPVLAKFISEITGKNFILDEAVRGKVSIISPTKVTPQQAYSIFQSVLQIKGFTTVQAGAVVKIVPSREVRESAKLTVSQQPEGDEYVTRMVKLRNVDVTSLINVVQPMVSHDGLVAAFPQDNTLIITDDAFNVQRLLRIIGSLDVEGVQQNVVVIPLKIAFADDVASQVEKIMTAREGAAHGTATAFMRPGLGVVAPTAQGGATSFSIVPDERTNSLIVLASPIELRQIKDLISHLDIRPPNETFRIHVYPLKYAPAGEMVDVLNGVLGGGGGPTTLSPQTGRNSLGRGSSLGNLNGSAFGSGFGGLGSNGGSSGFGGFGGNNYGGGGGTSNIGSSFGSSGSPTSMRRNSGGGGNESGGSSTASTGGKSPDFESPVSVTADLATNSLIISAAPQDYETLRRVVDQLDKPRIQVFVQAIIVEVSVQRAKDIGVNLLGSTSLGGGGNVLGLGSLNFGQLQNAIGNPLGLTGLGIGLASGKNCSIPSSVIGSNSNSSSSSSSTSTVSAPCDVALMTALQSDTHSNVLSAPTLLTADNEEAMIVVGQNVPFVGSSSANSALSGQIFNSVDRQNVGITLDIVPQVSAEDYVQLDVYEEVSNVVEGTANQQSNPLGPTTTIRSASTTVMVQNHRTAVIGGLISNEQDNGRQGVPYISSIPVLGNLFSSNNRSNLKQNLLVFLTPHVVRTREDLVALALDERQKFVRTLGRREVNNMPAAQFQSLYQPTFNRAVSPQEDMMESQKAAEEGGFAPMPGTSAPSTPPLFSTPSSSTPGASLPPSSSITLPPVPDSRSDTGSTPLTSTTH